MHRTILLIGSLAIGALAFISLPVGSQTALAQTDKPKIVHDAEY